MENPPRTVPGEGGDVTGQDAEFISAHASSIGAHTSWQVGDLDALISAVTGPPTVSPRSSLVFLVVDAVIGLGLDLHHGHHATGFEWKDAWWFLT